MESIVANSTLSSRSRSISLPSSSHPFILSLEQNLGRLRSSENASTSSTCQKLDGLKNLYESLDDVLQLPLSQKVFSHERNGKWEEEILDGSLRLLDICGTVKDIYFQMKETVQELQSSLRRKRFGELDSEVDTYMISKKRLNKMIFRCCKELKKAEKNCTLELTDKEVDLVKVIKQVQEVTLTTLESAVSFISGPKAGSQPRGWSLVSRMLQSKTTSCKEQSDNAGIQKIEAELLLLKNKKPNQENDLLKQLGASDENIQELVEILEVVFRLLLKIRVSLLNILNH